MGYSRFWLKMADEKSKCIPHEFPSSHWLKATGQCVLERYLSATIGTESWLNDSHFNSEIFDTDTYSHWSVIEHRTRKQDIEVGNYTAQNLENMADLHGES